MGISGWKTDPSSLESHKTLVKEFKLLEQRTEILERQVKSLRNRTRDTHELLDVLATPPWKRFWFFLKGFRLWRVGRWYGEKE